MISDIASEQRIIIDSVMVYALAPPIAFSRLRVRHSTAATISPCQSRKRELVARSTQKLLWSGARAVDNNKATSSTINTTARVVLPEQKSGKWNVLRSCVLWTLIQFYFSE